MPLVTHKIIWPKFPLELELHVTVKDIELGVPNSCKLCPVARASLRAVKKITKDLHTVQVRVHPTSLHISFERKTGVPIPGSPFVRYLLPLELQDMIERFDNCNYVPTTAIKAKLTKNSEYKA